MSVDTRNKYFKEIKKITSKHLSKNARVFVFGSSVENSCFNDIDIGVLYENDDFKLSLIREDLENSNIPYKVDLINFDEVEKTFKNKVMKSKYYGLFN